VKNVAIIVAAAALERETEKKDVEKRILEIRVLFTHTRANKRCCSAHTQTAAAERP